MIPDLTFTIAGFSAPGSIKQENPIQVIYILTPYRSFLCRHLFLEAGGGALSPNNYNTLEYVMREDLCWIQKVGVG